MDSRDRLKLKLTTIDVVRLTSSGGVAEAAQTLDRKACRQRRSKIKSCRQHSPAASKIEPPGLSAALCPVWSKMSVPVNWTEIFPVAPESEQFCYLLRKGYLSHPPEYEWNPKRKHFKRSDKQKVGDKARIFHASKRKQQSYFRQDAKEEQKYSHIPAEVFSPAK